MALDSPLTTYSDTTPHVRVITDQISMIDPQDMVVVDALGGLDSAAGKFRFAGAPGKVVEWLEDTLEPLTDALNGSITSTATTITVDDASVLQEGFILLIDSEQMWISSVNTSTEVLTVTRAYDGTAATHADNATVEVVGLARLEGADSDDLAFTDRTVGSNFTQIFHREVKVSRTHRKISQYGISDEFLYQEGKALGHLARLVAKQHYLGARKAGSATTPRAFGGFPVFITDNTINAGGAVTEADFENAMELAFVDGGGGNYIAFANNANKKVIDTFLDSTLRTDIDQSLAGMTVDAMRNSFGTVNVVLDRWARSDKIYIVDPNNVGMLTLQPFFAEELSKDGDYTKEEVIGEFTLCVRQDKSHAVITGIS